MPLLRLKSSLVQSRTCPSSLRAVVNDLEISAVGKDQQLFFFLCVFVHVISFFEKQNNSIINVQLIRSHSIYGFYTAREQHLLVISQGKNTSSSSNLDR